MLRLGEGKKNPSVGGRRALNYLRRLHGVGAVKLGKRYFYTSRHVQQLIEAAEVRDL